MPNLNESIVENAALEWFGELGYVIGHPPHFRKFRTLRDTLLPKQLSGELSVGAREPTIATVP